MTMPGLKKSLLRSALLISCAVVGAHAVPVAFAPAYAQAAVHEFKIPAQPLADALRTFANQTGRDVLFAPAIVAGKSSPGAHGALSEDVALQALLNGTGLTFRVTSTNGYAVLARAAAAATTGSNDTSVPNNDTGRGDASAKSNAPTDSAEPVEKVTVTGTRVRNMKDQFSPVKKISRDDMDRAGDRNLTDVFSALPQNFGGGISPDTNRFGPAGASGVNLRGLGNEATLVLLNGRRLAPGGAIGAFVDISAIPTTAIDRVEIMPDGASAIYGSDAIAGVVNIILRDDFNGAESSLSLSKLSDSGGVNLTAGQMVGWSGDDAHALLVVEYASDDELNANDKSFSRTSPDPNYLLPESDKYNVIVSTGIDLTDFARVSIDGYYNKRLTNSFGAEVNFSPVRVELASSVEQFGAAGSLQVDLFRDWKMELAAGLANSSEADESRDLNDPAFDGNIDDARTQVATADATMNGPVINISSEPVALALGMQIRSEKVDLLSSRRATGLATFSADRSRDVMAAFGELYMPIVSESDSIPLVNRLSATAAVRIEEFSDVGSSLNPKYGLAWRPIVGVNVRGTYGTSFRAPRLDQLVDRIDVAFLGVYIDPLSPTGRSTALNISGSTDTLTPEKARTWSLGFDISDRIFDGLSLRATYFDVRYSDRVGILSVGNTSDFEFTDFNGTILRDPDALTVASFVDRAAVYLNLADFFPSLGSLSLSDVKVIIDQRAQNLALSRSAGFDFDVGYNFDLGEDNVSLFLNSTLMTKFERRASVSSPLEIQLNTFGQPNRLKLRGGVQWQARSATASVYVNHTGSYSDPLVPAGNFSIGATTTMDASLNVDAGEFFGLSDSAGAQLTINVRNIFNEPPPAIGEVPFRGDLFDSANADPSGRSFGMSLRTSW